MVTVKIHQVVGSLLLLGLRGVSLARNWSVALTGDFWVGTLTLR